MKKVIKLTESQLKRIILEQQTEEQDNQFFKLINNQWGKLIQKRDDGNIQLPLSNGDNVIFTNTGVCYYVSKQDGKTTEGKITPIGTTEFKLIFEDGDTYDSVSEKWTDNTTPKPCANQLIDTSNGSLLKFGCKTQGVKELQTLLGFTTPTGYFGTKTQGLVKSFQQKNNLKVDGVVGPDTYKVLAPNATPKQQVDEYYDEDDDYNELDDLFDKKFNTEDDYEGEPFRGDDEGFSNKMRINQIQKKIKLGDTNMNSGRYMAKDMKKDRENEKRRYAGLDPLRNDTQPEPYSPIKNDDLPLHKFLEKRKMGNLDEDEDIAMLDNLFTKD